MGADYITVAALKLLANNIEHALTRDRNLTWNETVLKHQEKLELELDFVVSEYKDKILS